MVLGKNGTVNLPNTRASPEFARNEFVTGAAAYVMVLLIAAAYLGAHALRSLATYGRGALGRSRSCSRWSRPGCSWSGC